MDGIILTLYGLVLFGVSLYMAIKVNEHKEYFVSVIFLLLTNIINTFVGIFLIMKFVPYISIFSDWGIFFYLFIMICAEVLLLCSSVVAIVRKVREKISNEKEEWLHQGLKTAAISLAVFLAAMLVPYGVNYIQYNSIKNYSENVITEYLDEVHPGARILEFRQNVSYYMFSSSLAGFECDYTLRGEKYTVSTLGLKKQNVEISSDSYYNFNTPALY